MVTTTLVQAYRRSTQNANAKTGLSRTLCLVFHCLPWNSAHVEQQLTGGGVDVGDRVPENIPERGATTTVLCAASLRETSSRNSRWCVRQLVM